MSNSAGSGRDLLSRNGSASFTTARAGATANLSNNRDYQAWCNLAQSQDDLFLNLLRRNAELEERNKTLEFEKWTLSVAVQKLRDDTLQTQEQDLRSELAMLRHQLDSRMQSDTPLVACLLDGDGCIFAPEYLTQGELGGHLAAQHLRQGIFTHLARENLPTNAHIWTTVFLAKSGLESALSRGNICTPDELSAFLKGFNQSHPLFNCVDVGGGKDKADHKIHEHLDLFLRLPQTVKVYFGGAHDNGYGGALLAAQTNGFKHKLVLIQHYTQLAREIQSLDLPILSISDLFLSEKLELKVNNSRRLSHHRSRSGNVRDLAININTPPTNTAAPTPEGRKSSTPPVVAPQTPPTSPSKSRTPVSTPSERDGASFTSPTPTSRRKRRTPSVQSPLLMDPMPCLFRYLSPSGCQTPDCAFGHDYLLTDNDVTKMRKESLRVPCKVVNSGKCCDLDDCIYGHLCPRGARCDQHRRGLCEFVGIGMHR